jgi:ABC-type molybdate transport system permease subunit
MPPEIMAMMLTASLASYAYNSSFPLPFFTWNASIVTSTWFFFPFLCETLPRTASGLGVGEKEERSSKTPVRSLATEGYKGDKSWG